jgi:hypothetical protein
VSQGAGAKKWNQFGPLEESMKKANDRDEDGALIVIRDFLNKIEAELAQGALEAAGIHSIVSADDAGGNDPGLWMGGVKLLVRGEDAERAVEVLGPAK